MESHSIALKIDVSAAQAGSKQFTAAINAVKKAVADLDRDTTGAFTALRNISPKVDVSGLRAATSEANALSAAQTKTESASTRAAAAIQRTALSAASALRISENEAQRLSMRLNSLGDTSGVAKLQAELARLQSSLINAQTPLDVRGARSGFADTSNELRRHAAMLSENAAAEMQATNAATAHAASLDSLRSKYNPLFTASTQYAAALDEISMAEREGVITSQLAAQARERAAQSMLAASAANDTLTGTSRVSGAAVANLGYQFNDIGVMLAAGQSPLMLAVQQGTQVSQVLNGMGGGKAALSAVASGFLSIINPVSLVTVGVIAAGAAIFYWLTSAGEETKSFTDALGGAVSAVSTMESATRTLADATLGSLADGYGRVNAELQTHLEKLQQIAAIDATNATRDVFGALQSEVTGGWLTTDVDDLRIAFSTTNDEARVLLGMLDQIKAAKTFEEQFAAVTRMRQEVESITGGLTRSEGSAREFLVQLLKAEDAGLRLKASQDGVAGASDNASGAASNLAYTIGAAADAAALLLSNLNGVPGALALMGKSVGGQIAGIRAQNRALNLELSEGLSGMAANRTVQLQDMISTAGTRGQKLNFDQIAAESGRIAELDAAAKETERLRSAISEKNRPATTGGGTGAGSGGGRASALNEEQAATEQLNNTLSERLTSLEAERIELGLLASGQFETAEGARLMAEAMAASGGMVDAQTEAMIRQVDAAAALNEALRKVAQDPVKEWMKSVPNWIEAGQQIEMGAINSLKTTISDFIKTGKFDLESLGESVLGVFADIVADKATAEIMNLFGRGNADSKGLGGLFGGLFSSKGDAPLPGVGGDAAAVANGGIQAGTSISQAMVQAGQQVSQQIQAAMTGGGAQAGASVQSGLATGSVSVRTAGQQGLAIGANNIRMASTTGGATLGQGVVRGAQQGAPILAQGVASGAGGGGGFLSGVGGVGGLLGMILPGIFHDGGVVGSSSSSRAVPAALFNSAQRYHSGGPVLEPGEVPAILQTGEYVLPRGSWGAGSAEKGAGGNTVVQNMNFTFPNADVDSFRRSKSQVAADMARVGQNALGKNG